MTDPAIRVGQIWERRTGGRRVRIAAVSEHHGVVELEPVDYGRHSHPMISTLRREYRIVQAPPIGDWP